MQDGYHCWIELLMFFFYKPLFFCPQNPSNCSFFFTLFILCFAIHKKLNTTNVGMFHVIKYFLTGSNEKKLVDGVWAANMTCHRSVVKHGFSTGIISTNKMDLKYCISIYGAFGVLCVLLISWVNKKIPKELENTILLQVTWHLYCECRKRRETSTPRWASSSVQSVADNI